MRQLMGRKCPFIALQSTECGARFRSADMSNAPATLLNEVICCQLADEFIIDSHEICRQPYKAPIDENVRSSSLFDGAKTLDGPLRRGDQHRIHAARE